VRQACVRSFEANREARITASSRLPLADRLNAGQARNGRDH
jgi:hypothetical protein